MDPIATVKEHFGISLKRATTDEWRSLNGCPVCGDAGKGSDSDRFRVFTDGSPRWWCRRCGFQGFVDSINGQRWNELSPTERRRRRIESERTAFDQQERQKQLRREALEKVRSGDAERYHEALWKNTTAVNYWLQEGFTAETINRFCLGYAESCPMDYPEYRPSVTIPVRSGGLLWDIRHRILGADPGDKYRPHTKNLPRVLFNADNLFSDSDHILIVEGEKKSMAASQAGWRSVGVMGQDSFDADWASAFARFPIVYVIMDPDAFNAACEIAALFGDRGRAVQLPDKLDDLLNPYKGHRQYGRDEVWNMIISGGFNERARATRENSQSVGRTGVVSPV